jgi:hypothetical protein
MSESHVNEAINRFRDVVDRPYEKLGLWKKSLINWFLRKMVIASAVDMGFIRNKGYAIINTFQEN